MHADDFTCCVLGISVTVEMVTLVGRLFAGVAPGLSELAVGAKTSGGSKVNRRRGRVLPADVTGEEEAQTRPDLSTFLTGKYRHIITF